MKQVLIELDEDMVERLERVAPARSRRRSVFIREAISRALSDVEERRTAEAYRQQPDSEAEVYVDPRVWESPARYRKGNKRR
jgi:predicted transcriptional regulator